MKIKQEQILGILLAGGKATRMGGGDKCLKEVGGKPLLQIVRERAEQQVNDLVLNANGDLDRFKSYNLPLISDTMPGHLGPLAGVLSGMIWAKEYRPETKAVITFATDTPFFPFNLVEEFYSAWEENNDRIILAGSHGRIHSIIGLWPLSLAEDLQVSLEQGMRKIRAWTKRHEQMTIDFDDININGNWLDPFFNINTPDDLNLAEDYLSSNIANR